MSNKWDQFNQLHSFSCVLRAAALAPSWVDQKLKLKEKTDQHLGLRAGGEEAERYQQY